MVRHKLAVLREHYEVAQRDYATIETTHNNSWLLGRDGAAVAAKREGLAERGPLRGFVGTVSQAIDLIGTNMGQAHAYPELGGLGARQ